MRLGLRRFSPRKRVAAKLSLVRAVRAKVRAPRGLGWLTNPKRALKGRIYRRTTFDGLRQLKRLLRLN